MDMKSFCLNQIEEIKKHKWIMGEKLGKDPGDNAIQDWTKNHAKGYRENHKKCLNNLVEKVHEIIKNKQKVKKLELEENELKELEKIVIEEFTNIWIKEMILDESNKHLKEI